MEHSPYSQSPSPSSSLVNFPTPSNLPDIRLHRPFGQMHDLKHLHLPFQGANFGFRFMENYSALPAHLLHHLQPQFLHPALDPRISFSQTGVFQPLGSPNPHHQHPHHAAAVAAAGLKNFASAFAPPTKCYKVDDKSSSHSEGLVQQQQQQQQQQPLSSQQQQQQQQQLQQQQQQQQQVPPSFPYPPRRSPCSPASMSVSPPSSAAASATMHQHAKDECSDRDTPSSGAVSEDGRMIRRKKQSPPVATTTAGVTPAQTTNSANNNNNNSVNVNNNGGGGGGSIKQQQQQQQSSVAGQQQQQSAAAGCCPVCGAALRTAHELESHFVWELERLYKQAAAAGRRPPRGTPDKMGDGHHHNGLMVCARDGGAGRLSPVAGGSGRDGSLHGRWETYQKVKANRHNRLRIKNRKRKPDEMLLTPTPTTCCCPVCNEPVAAATQEQMNAHVEMCLRNKGHPASVAVTTVGNDDEDENVDVEGDTETTMYDMVYGGNGAGGGWPQHHNRMRQHQMILHSGGYNRGAGINCVGNPPPRQSAGEDPTGPEDAVLVVDDNEDGNGGLYNKYGPNQYAERDVIVPSRPPTASSEGRRLTPAEQNDSNAMDTMDSCENVGPLDVSIKKENTQEDGTIKPKMDVDKYCGQFNNNGQVVEALKARIRELESKTGCDKFTCLLCKGNFKDPVVSTSCWHVYCEVCWLQILGAKKLCPQCYVITLPSNLRRVYL